MTINALKKLVDKLVEQGNGRRQVCINKQTFNHPLESDGAVIQVVTGGEMDCHEMLDDDGGMKELANGQTAYRTALVLKGE